MDLDELLREGLAGEASRASFDAGRWATLPLRPRRPLPRPPVSRWVTAVAVAALLLAGIGVPLALLARLGGEGGVDRHPRGPTVAGFGLQLDLPPGWEGWVTGPMTGPQGDFGPILQAANVPLVTPEDDPFATETRRGLGPGQVAVVLIDYTEVRAAQGHEPGENGQFESVEPPIGIRAQDFQPSFEGVSPLHDFARRTFLLGGRSFDLWVEFGDRPAPQGLVAEVNTALATLQVEPLDVPTGMETYTDVEDTMSITLPVAWKFDEDPTQPIEPENIIAFGSWDFPRGGVCAPFAALEQLPADGAFGWLIEYHGTQSPEDFVPRPEHFDLDDFRYGKEYSCYGIVPQYQLRYREAGRYFQIQLAFGPQASDALAPEVLQALDSIRVTSICDAARDGYTPSPEPASGQPGSEATISGEVLHGEANKEGQSQPITWIEVWWNLDWGEWPSALPGGSQEPVPARPGSAAVRLGRVEVADSCTYQVPFVVPEAGPDTYPIVILYGDARGAAAYLPVNFEVIG